MITIPGCEDLHLIARTPNSTMYEGLRDGIEVIIKVPDMDEKEQSRFISQGKKLLRLKHPNIAETLGYGIDPLPFLVTRRVDGESLDQKLISPLPVKESARYILDACLALQYLYRCGFSCHGDLHPENILIAGDHAIIIDLPLTQPEHIIGSRARYLPPEGPIDQRSDVFCLGALAYEMITGGHIPVNHRSDLSGVMYGVPKALDEVITRSIAIDPKKRYRSVQAFKAAFTHATRQLSLKRRRSPSYRTLTCGILLALSASYLVGDVQGQLETRNFFYHQLNQGIVIRQEGVIPEGLPGEGSHIHMAYLADWYRKDIAQRSREEQEGFGIVLYMKLNHPDVTVDHGFLVHATEQPYYEEMLGAVEQFRGYINDPRQYDAALLSRSRIPRILEHAFPPPRLDHPLRRNQQGQGV
ncbi:serine/threonine protein kinase [Candidatus Woesearchaeota archaeon]|nr:MAG: Protein kinase family protein [archaeon GW2011_AR4]MBS3129592.1 serine/threonine protein kinase [Candidatus Woesearchaeota archaeon]HIH37699.1 serine/threonine protein kinase [Candidatus Woesearchaeota archaeon]HIH49051.1 serine/threonine protein kinase [Candidatus Woesearchaeota archaeon]HIJ02902.1 serine/threonine protein kinase [Candidatus Woesearchaeota archaeon]